MCLHLHVYYLFAVCSLLCVSSPYFPKMKKVGVGVLQYSNILCVKFNHASPHWGPWSSPSTFVL